MSDQFLPFKERFKLSRFFRGEAPVAGPVQLNHRRVFILPTQRGFGMVYTIVLLLLIAFIYNNNLVYLLAFFLASVFFVTILHTYQSLAGLVVQAGYAAPVFAGEQAGFGVSVNNPTEAARFGLTVRLENEIEFDQEPLSGKKLTLYASTSRRGWQPIDTVTLASSFPLGIFRAWSPLRFAGKVLVYPKPAPAGLLPLPADGGQESAGLRALERRGRDDFSGIRDYQAGDPLGQIHWKAYAKGQGLLSKQYASAAGGSELWLDYQQVPASHTEERLSVLCRWILDAEAAGLRYGLRLGGAVIKPDCGPAHQSRCLEALALF